MKKIIYAAMSFAPVLAFAQNTNFGTLDQIVAFVGRTIRSLIPIAFGLAIVYFFYGLAKFIRSSGDPKESAAGKNIMIYGVISIAVMLSIYGLVYWLQNVLGVTNNGAIPVPVING